MIKNLCALYVFRVPSDATNYINTIFIVFWSIWNAEILRDVNSSISTKTFQELKSEYLALNVSLAF